MFTIYKAKKNFFKENLIFKNQREWRIEQKTNILTALATTLKKDPTTSIRKHTKELKVHEKTVRTAIKQDLSPDLNPLDYAIRSVLENKTNATAHPNIGSLKTVFEEE